VEDAGADGSSEDAPTGMDATWHDFSAMQGLWQVRKPLQAMSSCDTQPPIGEYVRINFAAMHGGPAVGEYLYCNPEGGSFSTQRCFEAGRVVGGTGMNIAFAGDTFELVTHDEATGLSSGVLTTAKHGTYTFQATHCK
jgi:hypothetical protein